MSRPARLVRSLLVLALLTTPGAAHAQGQLRATTPVPALAPTVAASAVGVRARNFAPTPAPLPSDNNPFSELDSRGKMAWGGAALVVGLIVGGDVGRLLEIGGAGIGLWGLYQYLQ